MLCNHLYSVRTHEDESVFFYCAKCRKLRAPKNHERLAFGPVTVDAGKEVLVHVAARVPFRPVMLWLPLACREMLMLQITCGSVEIFKNNRCAPVEMFSWLNTLPPILWPQLEPGREAVTFRLSCLNPRKPGTFSGAFYMPHNREGA